MKSVEVEVSYSTKNRTFDVFKGDECVKYGTVNQVEKWLVDNGFEQNQDAPSKWFKVSCDCNGASSEK